VRRYGVIRQGSGLALRQVRIDLVHLLNQPCPGGLATGIGRHELVVAFQCGVRFGAIDHHAGVRCIAHLLERERAADHVAAEPLPALGIFTCNVFTRDMQAWESFDVAVIHWPFFIFQATLQALLKRAAEAALTRKHFQTSYSSSSPVRWK
jgi:hypothetical protein